MKITNIESGQAYQLAPGTELSVERTNPFFHEYGEQTFPVALPNSDWNQRLLKLPGLMQRKDKMKMIDASIEDGAYFSVCRQAVLGVAEDIDTSFYINDGSFYSRLGDVSITDVFADECVPDVSTVEQAISFMEQIWLSGGKDEKFACFQVQVEDEEGKRNLNVWERRSSHFGGTFYNAVDRVEHYKSSAADRPSDGGRVHHDENLFIPKGFYITPFIKANYVLKRLFQHFGYTLQDNFFTRTEQFTHMVFLNNVADSIVTGKISLAQLLPKVTCKKILNLFRKKFCCEFITDEVARTATVVMLNDVLASQRKVDLSQEVVGNIRLKYPDSYRQLIIRPESTVGSGNESSLDSLAMIRSQFPTAQFSAERGLFIRNGFKFQRYTESVQEVVADSSQSYYEGGNLPTVEIEVPEAIPSSVGHGSLFVGKVQYLNSSLRFGTIEENQELTAEDTKSSSDEMNLMLAFAYRNGSYSGGTVTAFGSNGFFGSQEDWKRIGDYSLIYNGDDGIFEKFYRPYDSLLRNSLHTLEVDLLLTQQQKKSIRSTDKINIDGVDCLIDNLKFKLGANGFAESRLLTLQLYEPVKHAKKLLEIVPPLSSTGYKWVAKNSSEQLTKEQYESSIYKEVGTPLIFPPQATVADVGKKFFERKSAICVDSSEAPRPVHGESYWLFTFWLEAVKE